MDPQNPYDRMGGTALGAMGLIEQPGLTGTLLDRMLREAFNAGERLAASEAEDRLNEQRAAIFESGVEAALGHLLGSFDDTIRLAEELAEAKSSERRLREFEQRTVRIVSRLRDVRGWVTGRRGEAIERVRR